MYTIIADIPKYLMDEKVKSLNITNINDITDEQYLYLAVNEIDVKDVQPDVDYIVNDGFLQSIGTIIYVDKNENDVVQYYYY